MLNRTTVLRSLVMVGALSLPCALVGQQPMFPVDFSADKFISDSKQNIQSMLVGKIYVGKGIVRQEMQGPRGPKIVYLINPAEGTTWQMVPDQKMASEMSELLKGMNAGKSLQNLKPADPSHPCAEWKSVTCQKVGSETVNGRSTQKWEFTAAGKGAPVKSYQWIDPKLNVVIKQQNDHESSELRNIVEGPQPANLFEIPSDYRKITPKDIKQNHSRTPQ